jgi:hypothetical protein
MNPMTPDARLAEEAVRVFRRYQLEVVEGFKLCPWAERTRTDRSMEERVVLSPELDLEPALDAIDDIAKNARLEIGIVLFPALQVDRQDFERFVSALSAREAERHPIGATPFAMAAFHPRALPDMTDAERLIAFLRRTPDPTIQVVRQSSLERVREGFNEGTQFLDISALNTLDLTRDAAVPLRRRIALANLRTVQRLGVEEVERRMDAILADRNTSYARIHEAGARARP